MPIYRAVVKYPLAASCQEKRRALLEGLDTIAMELVAEHNFGCAELENAFEEALAQGEIELEAKASRPEADHAT